MLVPRGPRGAQTNQQPCAIDRLSTITHVLLLVRVIKPLERSGGRYIWRKPSVCWLLVQASRHASFETLPKVT